jgi:hypothetical protein
MQDLALQPAKQPQTKAIQAETASEPGKVTGKLAIAVDFMVEEGLVWEKAAVKAGLTVRAMRKALQKPHVVKHLKHRRDVFRNSVCAANIHRLAAIRDAADNMPAVNAIKELERLGEDNRAGSSGGMIPPGLTIIIENGGSLTQPAPRIINNDDGSST